MSWVQGLPRKAMKGIDSFISAHPDLSTGYYFRAMFNNENKEFKKVEDDITMAIESKLQVARIETYHLLELRAASRIPQEGKLPGAIADITEALALDPSNVDLLFWRSRMSCRQGDKDNGWLDIKTIIYDPRLWNSTFADKAVSHCLILHRLEEANRLVERALIDFPGNRAFVDYQTFLKDAAKDSGTEWEDGDQNDKMLLDSIAATLSAAQNARREGNTALMKKYKKELETAIIGAAEQTQTDKSKAKRNPTIPDFAKIYAESIQKLKVTKPDLDMLQEVSGISVKKWSGLLNDPAFLKNLKDHLDKRAKSFKFSKTTKSKKFWSIASEQIDFLVNDFLRKKNRGKETRYRDDRRTKEVHQTVSLESTELKEELENDVNKSFGGKKARWEPEE